MIHLDAKTYLLRAGDPPTCGYLIEKGTLEVVLERPEGEQILAVLGPGEIVGEMALIDRAPRTAHVRSREACLLLPITAENIAKRLAAADPILQLFLGTVLERFRTTLNNVAGREASSSRPSTQASVIAAATADLRLEKELEAAIENGDIVVYYQPIVHLATGRLAGFEALSRWAHPTRGQLPPSIFIPLAEATGLSERLAYVCLKQVVRDLGQLQASAAQRPAHIGDIEVAINISGHDLASSDLMHRLGEIAATAGQRTSAITLELTETALVHSPSEAAANLATARRLGFKIAVDDFGTGFSSLNYVRTLPVDALKIDRVFVEGIADCATTRSIVDSMVRLGASLDLRVVGEGIETAEQGEWLVSLGCTFGQGYLFGRPVPFEQTLALMATWQAARRGKAIRRAPAAQPLRRLVPAAAR